MNSQVQIYFDEHGRVDAAYVHLVVNGERHTLDFVGSLVSLLALYPEDADTVHDYFTPINHVVLPDKDSQDVGSADDD